MKVKQTFVYYCCCCCYDVDVYDNVDVDVYVGVSEKLKDVDV